MKNKTYVLKNAVILDGTENMQPITGKKLLIENGIIADILPDDADTGSAEVIDLNGKYLMPGLINLHVHLPGSGMPKHTKKQNAESVRRLMSFAPSRAVVYSLCRGFAK
ncbi:MAG: amidohydrolase family protein, partial [Oscillospiraceae bacterium]|nr:amidohydrolase family protein [Oscillospiraceae bacterium]